MLIMPIQSDPKNHSFIMTLYQDHSALVRYTIYKITCDKNTVDDLVNDAFIKLMEKVNVLRSLSCHKMVTYVVYTARSVAINYIKHRDVQKKHTYYGSDADMSEKIVDLAATIEEKVVSSETIADMRQAMLDLPEKYREVLNQKYLVGLKDADIAELLEIKSTSVQKYLARARREMKRRMQEVEGHE